MDDLSVSAELLPQIPDLTQEEWYLPEEDNPLQDIMNVTIQNHPYSKMKLG